MKRPGDPNSAVVFQNRQAGSYPRSIERVNIVDLIPLALVTYGDGAVFAGEMIFPRKIVRRVGKN